ncbi:MAG TPA: PLP-dependent transferase, partial [Candidatus Methanoperedenaceae archaeon]|nr:PLP-dependent transferase [Candidatus Methanoperedenaceae archaeon]
MKFSTRAIHCDKEKLAVSPPIFQTSSFRFEDPRAAQEIMSGKRPGYAYSRTSNPTVTVLEKTMASLEGAGGALCFGSGMAAISALFFSTLRKGDHLLADEVLYGSTYDLISGLLP